MQETKADSLRVGALAQRIQGYKAYGYWRTIWDDCGKLEGSLTDNVKDNVIFDLESYAFAPKIDEPIKIKAYDFFDSVIPRLYYITNESIIQKLLYLREENLSLFKPYLTAQDVKDLKELIQSSLISQEEKLISLAFLLMVSSKKHNAFLLSLDKQESFYKRMQVFEQEKEIFEIYLDNKIDFLKVLNFAFCPTSSYAFAEYLLNTFTKEILTSFYMGMNQYIRFLNVSVKRYNDSRLFPYKEVEFTPTPFRLIDICLLQAFFSARLDLMLLLEQKGGKL